ncbi:hypothetical protein AURDEDRAFT_110147 [Auricularia subglabra TFB-10046 SS5]|nr:hypothetical protein AURDEDRAFT_110147 [Auricularia subglabra TFB-10046 SS5]
MAVDNWLARLQAIAVITVLFAGVQSQLLSSLPEDGGRSSDVALRFFAYGGLFLNLGGTLSAVLLLLAITSVPVAARHIYVACKHSYPRQMFRPHPNSADPARESGEIQELLMHHDGDMRLLRAFGLARGWDLILNHCIASFILGCVFTFVQITFTAWIAERTLAAALILPTALFGVCPPLYVFFFLMSPHKCQECAEEERNGLQAQSRSQTIEFA